MHVPLGKSKTGGLGVKLYSKQFWLFVAALFLVLFGYLVYQIVAGGEKATNVDENVIKIGSILDLTGPAASFGEMQLQGLNLAVAEIQNDDCPVTVELIVEDSRLESKLATTAANKLIDVDGVSAITSITGSGMALQIAPIVNRKQVPVLDSLSSSPALTDEGGAYYFRVQPDDYYSGRYLVDWIKSEDFSSVFIVYADSDWGQGLLNAISDSTRESGIAVIGTERVKRGDFEFRPVLARIRESNPDAIFLVANPQESGIFIRHAKDFGVQVPIYGSDTLSTKEATEAAGDAINSVRYVLASEGEGTKLKSFSAVFREKYGSEPSSNSIRPYDALMVLNHIACRNGTNRESLFEGLKELQGYKGIVGEIEFDENGDIVSPAFSRYEYNGLEPQKLN